MSARPENAKCAVACNYCRLKKAKCGGTQPCGTCVDHNEVCVYPERQRRVRKRKEREQDVDDRLARMEALLRAATQQPQTLLQGHSPTTGHGAPNDTGAASSPFATREHHHSRDEEPGTDVGRLQPPLSSQQHGPSKENINVAVQAGSANASTRPGGSSRTGSNTTTRMHSLPFEEPVALMSPDIQDCLLSLQTQDSEPPNILPPESNASGNRRSETGPDTDMSYPAAAAAPFIPTPASSYAISSTINEPEYSSTQLMANAASSQTPTGPRDQPPVGLASTTAFSNNDHGVEVDEDESHEQNGGAENEDQESPLYHMSICSPHGIEWVSDQIGNPDFRVSARRLSKDLKRTERLESIFDPTQSAEPDMETALKWTGAYFDTCLDSVFGVLNRDDFYRRMRSHFEGVSQKSSAPDKTWYALRNTVYALGCRAYLSEKPGPAAYVESRTVSWRYFENALAAHTDLIYGRAEVTSVRTLILMAFYAEALGSPALEYMLISNATRLALATGLYLAAPKSNKLTPEEALSRQWLWWVLYSYEKHVAFISGRPSAIDDDFITCPVPSTISLGNTPSCDFVGATIEHAQISSAISKQLVSAKAAREPLEATLTRVRALGRRLDDWHKSLHSKFTIQPPFHNTLRPPGTQPYHNLFLHFCYHSSVIAIHGVFCYPWNRPDLQKCENSQVQAQIRKSTEAVAEASRQIIIAVQGLQITPAMPLWLTFFFPLVGLMNLFVYILKYPFASSVASDLFLMDVVVGHFGYLNFISASEFVFPFPREIASYAGHLVRKAARESAGPSGGGEDDSYHNHQKHKGNIPQFDSRRKMKGKEVLPHQTVTLSPEMSGFSGSAISGFDIREDWYGTLLPPFPQLASFEPDSNFMEDELDLFAAGDMQQ